MTEARDDSPSGPKPAGADVSLPHGDTLPAPGHDPQLGKLIDGRYLLLEVLGEGGMGSVYRANHVLMDKPVAVKLIHSELAHLPEVARRFEREARSSSRLTDPHCISVTDFGRTEDGNLFLVMEILEGESLADRLARDGALPAAKAVDITVQILKALAHAHGAGVVHRDLKPENVMLVTHGDETDFAKILDFGIAKLASGSGSGEKLTQSGLVFGTPPYLSPEQALGQDVDHRADLYAAGIMLFEMLTGLQPFRAESAMQIISMHITAPIPSLAEHGRFPAGMQGVIDKAMAKQTGDRFASADEFMASLQALDPGAVEEAVPRWAAVMAVLARYATRARDRFLALDPRRRLFVGGVASAVVLALVLLIALSGKDEASKVVYKAVPAKGVDEDRLTNMIEKADGQLRAGLPSEAIITAKEILAASPDQPSALLLLGHAQFAVAERTQAMESYDKALSLSPELAADVRLREYLVQGLKWGDSQNKAALLLARHGDDAAFRDLTTRASSGMTPGGERRAARAALVEIGKGSGVDWLASLTADFLEQTGCKERKEIIAQIEKTGDPRFIPLLEEHQPKAKKGGFFRGLLRRSRGKPTSCISADLARVIETLTAVRDQGKEPTP
ncbi:MAG: protein kinase [Deltaproteobacteria bacterium]|nr:protein kinase [Deltaproteobacteria bacterium]